jgi:hypothetical protein
MSVVISIDLNVRCRACRKKGATQGGLCLGCIAKRIGKKAATKPQAPRRAQGELFR